jgi:deaminated glutathione amidase
MKNPHLMFNCVNVLLLSSNSVCVCILIQYMCIIPHQTCIKILLRARAIETQSFVIASAQVGHHNEKRMSWGQAIIIDPWGVILAAAPSFDDMEKGATAISNCNADDAVSSGGVGTIMSNSIGVVSPCIVTARLDLDRLKEVRTKMPVMAHRRKDLFHLEVK